MVNEIFVQKPNTTGHQSETHTDSPACIISRAPKEERECLREIFYSYSARKTDQLREDGYGEALVADVIGSKRRFEG